MQKIVLIGSNIAHSFSPSLHNYLFDQYSLPFRYELMPLEEQDVPIALEKMKREGYRGANITSPHKLIAFENVDELSSEAERIGSINTIVISEGQTIGYNTDVIGFRKSLEGEEVLEKDFSAAILGTGGAARAAVAALLEQPHLVSLTMYSREEERAQDAAEQWSDSRITGRSLKHFVPGDLIVHATPVGLAGSGASLLSSEQLEGGRLLYDMIYWPRVTPLMEAANRAGLRTKGGLEMFIGQALESFRLWTGCEARQSDIPQTIFAQ